MQRLLERLHQRLWLLDHGHVEIGEAGQLLERSLIDVSVASPERLIFEGEPIILDGSRGPTFVPAGLEVDPELDLTHAREGVAIPLPPLTDDEHDRYAGLVANAKATLKPTAEKKGVTYHVARGASEETARALVRGDHNGETILPLTVPLVFREFGRISVREALLDPDRYNGRDCLDPVEPTYRSKWCARFIKGDGRTRGSRDGTCFIKSFAHGGKTYQLAYDFETADVALKTCRPDLKPQTYWSCVCRMGLDDDIREEIGRRLA
jgi:hypothetical protein